MLDYFLSSDWAIIATELLAGFFVITLILAFLVWRGQRRHADAAERLLDDRKPILQASEEMVNRQAQRVWPGLELDDEQRQIYAERSLDTVEAMVEPWLEPKRHDLSSVARQFQRVRQEDLEQLLTVARAHSEATQADDVRVTELEEELRQLREQRDRQANQLNDSLETVNVMVREYGRKFDYNEEPHVATVLKAIVMVQEMKAGADCETAQQRAEDVFTEDLVAAPAPTSDDQPPAEAMPETAGIDAQNPSPDKETAAELPTTEPSAATDSIDVGGEQTSQGDTVSTTVDTPAPADSDPDTVVPDSGQAAAGAVADAADDIDALIAQTQASRDTTSAASDAVAKEAGGDTSDASEPAAETAQGLGEPEEDTNRPGTQEQPEPADAAGLSESSSSEDIEDDTEENGVIDLDDVEIPEDEKEGQNAQTDTYDLDDIDALLDAEIAKKHGKSSE